MLRGLGVDSHFRRFPPFWRFFQGGTLDLFWRMAVSELEHPHSPLLPTSTWRDLFIDPHSSFDKAVHWNFWKQAVTRETGYVEDGYRFRYAKIPGGRRGLRFSIDFLKPQYRRLMWRDYGYRHMAWYPTRYR